MGVADRQSMWKGGFNPLDYCFISRAHCGITTDINIQYTADIGMEAVLLWSQSSVCTGDLIFGHAGATTSQNDRYDFRLFIFSQHNLILDRANGRSQLGDNTTLADMWHKVTFEGNNKWYFDQRQIDHQVVPSYNSNSLPACFFSFPWKDNSQNDVAVRYVRLYNTSTQQDIVHFVPYAEGMMDLVSGKMFAPSSSSAQFEVVKWKSLSEVEQWKDLNEGLALILAAIDEMSWKEAA